MEHKPTQKSGGMSSKIRKVIAELGVGGLVMFIGAGFVMVNLLNDNFGFLSQSHLSSTSSVDARNKEQITALFDSIEGVTVDSINISYKTVADSSTTLFASNQTDTVSNGVVIVYRGTIKAPYDVTNAISLLLDVPFHQISLLNASELGGN